MEVHKKGGGGATAGVGSRSALLARLCLFVEHLVRVLENRVGVVQRVGLVDRALGGSFAFLEDLLVARVSTEPTQATLEHGFTKAVPRYWSLTAMLLRGRRAFAPSDGRNGACLAAWLRCCRVGNQEEAPEDVQAASRRRRADTGVSRFRMKPPLVIIAGWAESFSC
jgi:hypothetical protein